MRPEPQTETAPESALEVQEQEDERSKAGDIALLDDPTFSAYKWSIWRLLLPDESAQDPSAKGWEHVATKIGPIDEEWARANLGGGTFEFRGYFDPGDGGGRRLFRRPVIRVAGQRKNFNTPAPPAAAASVATSIAPTATDPMLARLLERMDDRLDRLERNGGGGDKSSLKEVAEALVMLKGLTSAPAQNPDLAVVNSYLQMIQKGVELGQSREPLPPAESGGTDWGKVIENGLPILDKLLARLSERRAARMGRPPSKATVVDEPAAATTAPPPATPAEAPKEQSAVSHRMMTAIEAIANSVRDHADPGEFAISLEQMLNPLELGWIRSKGTDELLAELSPFAGQFPILATPEARMFVDAVLSELKATEDDSASS